jgi:hypothetical protein
LTLLLPDVADMDSCLAPALHVCAQAKDKLHHWRGLQAILGLNAAPVLEFSASVQMEPNGARLAIGSR